MTTPDLLTPPSGRHLSRWEHLTRRERAHAALIALRHHIPLDVSEVRFDTDTNEVAIKDERGTKYWSVCRVEAEETLAGIAERFGDEARRLAEEVCNDG